MKIKFSLQSLIVTKKSIDFFPENKSEMRTISCVQWKTSAAKTPIIKNQLQCHEKNFRTSHCNYIRTLSASMPGQSFTLSI